MNLCSATGAFVNFLYEQYKLINLDKVINITRLAGDHIIIDRYLEVYAFKMEGYSNFQSNISEIEQLHSAYKYSDEYVRIMVCFVKTASFQGNYLFCSSRDLALNIQDRMEIPMLSDDDIVNALFDSYLINDYYIDEDNRFKSSVSMSIDHDHLKEDLDLDPTKTLIPTEFDILYYKAREIIKEAVYEMVDNYTIFQAYKFKNKERIELFELFRLNWEGAIYLYFDLSYGAALSKANMYKRSTRDEGGDAHAYAKEICEAVESKDVSVCLANCMMVLKDEKLKPDISNILGIDFVKKQIGAQNILSKTLLLDRDSDFSCLIMTTDIQKFIAVIHKKEAVRTIEGREVDIDFYGFDINGAFVNYIFRENDNPHAIMIAASGSGKSLSIQKIISQIIRFDAKTYIAKLLDKKQVRYFDIGFSAQNFINALQQEHGDLIDEISPKINDMRFNIIDIGFKNDKIDTDDFSFAMGVFDLALECSGSKEERLSAAELSQIKKAIQQLYEDNVYENVALLTLEKEGFTELCAILYEKGYDKLTTINDIKEEDAHLVETLKKPLLSDLYAELKKKSKSHMIDGETRRTIEGAMGKVTSVDSLEVFSKHPKFHFGTNNMVYFDVNNIKSDERLFAPIYMYVLMSYYNHDKEQALDIRLKRKKRKFSHIPQSYYIIEEAHNFMRYDSFKKVFDILSREARKYGVHMIFVSQRPSDIPADTISSIATRIYMSSMQKKNENISAVRKHVGIDADVEWVFKKIGEYQMLVHYDKGVFGCKFAVSKEELELFTTSA